MTEEQKAKVLVQAKFIAAIYGCRFDKEHINAIEDFWNIAQDDLAIPAEDRIVLPDDIVEQLE